MRGWNLFLTLLGIDILVFFLSFFLAYHTRIFIEELFYNLFPPFNFNFSHFFKNFWLSLLFFFILAYEGLYTKNFHSQEEIKRILRGILVWLIFVFFLIGLAKRSDEISRTFITFLAFYLAILLPSGRRILKNFMHKRNIGIRRVFVVGISQKTLEAVSLFLKDPHLGYMVRGIFDEKFKGSIKIEDKEFKVRSLEILKRALKRNVTDTVILSFDLYKGDERLLVLLSDLQRKVPEVFFIPSEKILSLLNFESITIYPSRVTFFKSQTSMNSKINILLKYFLDITITLCILPLALFLGLIIALLIKIDSPGPILFVQNRVGKGGKIFKLLKFRTMYIDAEERLKEILEENESFLKEWNQRRKLPEDPRITRIGKLLRRYSLDELPQFINILKGDMSLIGPRPVTEEELEMHYKEFKEIYCKVKPGLTGLWQVMGRNEIDYPTRVSLDVYYVLNWSPWLDFYILLKTPFVVITGKGAY